MNPSQPPFFELVAGEGPIVGAAIHAGHAVRADVLPQLLADDATRLREEDPHTQRLAAAAPSRIIGCRSRFEVDLNRPRHQAVYLKPEHAWGLDVWREPLPREAVDQSLANYDLFYAATRTLLESLAARHGFVVVLDIHSYNHRRDGAHGPEADPAANPEVNLGTASIDRALWGPLVDRFLGDLHGHDLLGQRLDVRENVKFQGGHFPRWINANFPATVCAIAVEFKKTFMDEWTGEVDEFHLHALHTALSATLPGLTASLAALSSQREPAPVGSP
ncbi:MAG TPA: N-formylglutamate amidohydrolase [Lacipirellulaceae bacterium]|nr:N-formylglutamate amidohydrolase [Lacipirellulaceae bacterium]